jgi:hypothetical protein
MKNADSLRAIAFYAKRKQAWLADTRLLFLGGPGPRGKKRKKTNKNAVYFLSGSSAHM